MRNVFATVSLMSVIACVVPSGVEPSTEGAMNVAPIAVNLFFAGDPDDGGAFVEHQQGQVRFEDGEAGARAMSALSSDLTQDIPIPAGTEVDSKYLGSRASDLADLLHGLGYAVNSVCIGSVCSGDLQR